MQAHSYDIPHIQIILATGQPFFCMELPFIHVCRTLDQGASSTTQLTSLIRPDRESNPEFSQVVRMFNHEVTDDETINLYKRFGVMTSLFYMVL